MGSGMMLSELQLLHFLEEENERLMHYHMVVAQETQKQLVFNNSESAVLGATRRVLRFSNCIEIEGYDVAEVDKLLLPLTPNTWPSVRAWANAMDHLTTQSFESEPGVCP